MAPLLKDGDFLLYSTRFPAKIANGKIVLAKHDTLGLIIKRIKSSGSSSCLSPNGEGSYQEGYSLEGVSSLSTASEHIGVVPHEAILGVARYRITRTRFLPIRLP